VQGDDTSNFNDLFDCRITRETRLLNALRSNPRRNTRGWFTGSELRYYAEIALGINKGSMGVADRRGRGDPSPPSEDLHHQVQAAKPSVQFGGKSVGRAGLTCPW
jgi:hypothetical protein